MDLYWIKTNNVIKQIFFNQVWSLPNAEKKIYLTFDDGPTTIATEWILSVLKKHEIKATFFCIGNNIRKNPSLFRKIIQEGHCIGNHTQNHLQGWKTSNKVYLENIHLCEEEIRKQTVDHVGLLSEDSEQKTERKAPTAEIILENTEKSEMQSTSSTPSKFFRPPYGKIGLSQSAQLRRKGYKIIMWDVLSADFDPSTTPNQCLQNVIENTTEGSIIVFHDSQKAFRNLEYALPRSIEILKKKGFQFATID